MASTKPTLKIKRGDDFKLELTVTDKNNTTAIAAKVVLDAANAADPQVPTDITNAQAAYDAAIIVDITGWGLLSQIRWCGKLIATLTSSITDALNGVFTLEMDAVATALWTPREYDCDIEFDRPVSGVVSSQTFIVNVEEDVSFNG